MNRDDLNLRFSVDMSYMDLGAVIELSNDSCMIFRTREEREHFFARIELDPRSVPYGAALLQARNTNLGFFGSEDLLYQDCAAIMVAEFRRLEYETGRILKITLQEIMESQEFRNAYEIVRAPKKAAINNFVRSLGTNSERLLLQEIIIDQDTITRLNHLHELVLSEVRGLSYGLRYLH